MRPASTLLLYLLLNRLPLAYKNKDIWSMDEGDKKELQALLQAVSLWGGRGKKKNRRKWASRLLGVLRLLDHGPPKISVSLLQGI